MDDIYLVRRPPLPAVSKGFYVYQLYQVILGCAFSSVETGRRRVGPSCTKAGQLVLGHPLLHLLRCGAPFFFEQKGMGLKNRSGFGHLEGQDKEGLKNYKLQNNYTLLSYDQEAGWCTRLHVQFLYTSCGSLSTRFVSDSGPPCSDSAFSIQQTKPVHHGTQFSPCLKVELSVQAKKPSRLQSVTIFSAFLGLCHMSSLHRCHRCVCTMGSS